MGLGIVPIQLLVATPYFVAVTLNEEGASIPSQTLIDNQAVFLSYYQLAAQFGITASPPDYHKG